MKGFTDLMAPDLLLAYSTRQGDAGTAGTYRRARATHVNCQGSEGWGDERYSGSILERNDRSLPAVPHLWGECHESLVFESQLSSQ